MSSLKVLWWLDWSICKDRLWGVWHMCPRGDRMIWMEGWIVWPECQGSFLFFLSFLSFFFLLYFFGSYVYLCSYAWYIVAQLTRRSFFFSFKVLGGAWGRVMLMLLCVTFMLSFLHCVRITDCCGSRLQLVGPGSWPLAWAPWPWPSESGPCARLEGTKARGLSAF